MARNEMYSRSVVLVFFRALVLSSTVRVVTPLTTREHAILIFILSVVLELFRRHDTAPPPPVRKREEEPSPPPLNPCRDIRRRQGEIERRHSSIDVHSRSRVPPRRFYAVARGVNPGIYTSWDDCARQVVGVSGALHKSFSSVEKAEEYIRKKRYF